MSSPQGAGPLGGGGGMPLWERSLAEVREAHWKALSTVQPP